MSWARSAVRVRCAARIPCGQVNDVAQALTDAQIVARDMVIEVPLDGGGQVRMPGVPMKFSASHAATFSAPPALGRDTDSVLTDLPRYQPDRVLALKADKVVQ